MVFMVLYTVEKTQFSVVFLPGLPPYTKKQHRKETQMKGKWLLVEKKHEQKQNKRKY